MQKMNNFKQFIAKELKTGRKYILSPIINFVYHNSKLDFDSDIRHYFSHYHHVDYNQEQDTTKNNAENTNTNVLNMLHILDEVLKQAPTIFAVQTFAQISRGYSKYIGNTKKITNLFSQNNNNKEIKIEHCKQYLKIKKEGFEFRLIHTNNELFSYFFIPSTKGFKVNEDAITSLVDKAKEKRNQYDKIDDKQGKIFRINKEWLSSITKLPSNNSINQTTLEKFIKNQYKVKYREVVQQNLNKKFFKITEEDKKISINFITESNTFFALKKLDHKIYNKNKSLIHYFIDLHRQTGPNNKHMDLLQSALDFIYNKQLNKSGSNNDSSNDNNNILDKQNDIYVLDISETVKASKLKNKVDEIFAKNFAYSTDLIKWIFEFEKKYFVQEYNNTKCKDTKFHYKKYVDFKYESINKATEEDLKKELKKCGLTNVKEFFKELQEIRKRVLHANFPPKNTEDKTELQKIVNYANTKKQTENEKDKEQLNEILLNLGVAIKKYFQLEQFNKRSEQKT